MASMAASKYTSISINSAARSAVLMDQQVAPSSRIMDIFSPPGRSHPDRRPRSETRGKACRPWWFRTGPLASEALPRGHCANAVYRGDKVTRGVWEEVRQGGYIAQNLAPLTERGIRIDGETRALKLDVRLYT